jgi:hypothetical protein
MEVKGNKRQKVARWRLLWSVNRLKFMKKLTPRMRDWNCRNQMGKKNRGWGSIHEIQRTWATQHLACFPIVKKLREAITKYLRNRAEIKLPRNDKGRLRAHCA